MSKIVCPKCGSDQITSNKKGFSGKKAIGGAILTGGVGLLAGTLGSNKVKITCLACGNEFKPGEGKIIYEGSNQGNISNDIHPADVIFITNRIKEGGMLNAVEKYRDYAKISLEESKRIVDDVAARPNTQPKPNPGCAGIVLFLIGIAGLTYLIF